jgi:thiol:disulfide interchange protein DsbC
MINEVDRIKSVVSSLVCVLLLVFGFVLVSAAPGYTFGSAGAAGCESDCNKCHSLTYEEASGILKKMNSSATVMGIKLSRVKGLWEVSIDDNGRKGVFYTDFTKKFLVAGPIVEIESSADAGVQKPQEKRVDVSKIPVDGALLLGDAAARIKVIVFTDPECPFCARLHQEMKKVVDQRKDIAFYIKLYPLEMHKDAYWKANAIQCKKSLSMMDDNFNGKPIARSVCDSKEIDDNLKLATSLGITGTPTLVLPDGRVHAGALPADELIKLIGGGQ